MANDSSTSGPPWMTSVPNLPSQTSPIPQVPPELSGHESQYFISTGETFIGITCMLLVLCTAAVVGRLVARRMAKATLQVDDYASLLALFLLVVASIENFLFAHYIIRMQGPGPSSVSALRGIGHLSLANGLTYSILITVARCSVLLLYRRVFSLSKSSFKRLWWTCVGLVLGYFFAMLVGILLECSPHPLATLWRNPPACHGSNDVLMIMGFVNAVVNICVLSLPIRPVWTLHMPLGKKLLVGGLFGLGFLDVAISLARAAVLTDPNAFENGGGLAFSCWSTAEAAVALLCSCLPLQRPIFIRAYTAMSSVRTRLGLSRRSTSLNLPTFRDKHDFGQEILPTTTTTPTSSESQVRGPETASEELKS